MENLSKERTSMTTLADWNQVVATANTYLRDLDPIMAHAIERVGPCTLTPNPNLFETLVDAIISQQISVKAADAELVKVKGIGRWTAEMMLIFSLGRPDVLPVDDLGFLEGVREAYSLDARPTPKEMRERGEIWRPYRTFATWYMWGVRRLAMKYEKERTRIVSL